MPPTPNSIVQGSRCAKTVWELIEFGIEGEFGYAYSKSAVAAVKAQAMRLYSMLTWDATLYKQAYGVPPLTSKEGERKHREAVERQRVQDNLRRRDEAIEAECARLKRVSEERRRVAAEQQQEAETAAQQQQEEETQQERDMGARGRRSGRSSEEEPGTSRDRSRSSRRFRSASDTSPASLRPNIRSSDDGLDAIQLEFGSDMDATLAMDFYANVEPPQAEDMALLCPAIIPYEAPPQNGPDEMDLYANEEPPPAQDMALLCPPIIPYQLPPQNGPDEMDLYANVAPPQPVVIGHVCPGYPPLPFPLHGHLDIVGQKKLVVDMDVEMASGTLLNRCTVDGQPAEMVYGCNRCPGFKSGSIVELEAHNQRQHNVAPKLVCDNPGCTRNGAEFKATWALRRHRRICNPQANVPQAPRPRADPGAAIRQQPRRGCKKR